MGEEPRGQRSHRAHRGRRGPDTHLEALADLEGVAVATPLVLGEAPQGQLIVEHGLLVREGLRRQEVGVCVNERECV